MKNNFFLLLIRIMLAFLFIYAGLVKLLNLSFFRFTLSQSPLIIPSTINLISIFIPVIELLTALMLIFTKTYKIGLLFSLFLMNMFTIYLLALITFYSKIPCACGGILGKTSYTVHILFNLLYIGITLAGIYLVKKSRLLKT